MAWIWALLLNKAKKMKHPQITSQQRNHATTHFVHPDIDLNLPIMARYMCNNVLQSILNVNKDDKLDCMKGVICWWRGFSDVTLFVDVSFFGFIQM